MPSRAGDRRGGLQGAGVGRGEDAPQPLAAPALRRPPRPAGGRAGSASGRRCRDPAASRLKRRLNSLWPWRSRIMAAGSGTGGAEQRRETVLCCLVSAATIFRLSNRTETHGQRLHHRSRAVRHDRRVPRAAPAQHPGPPDRLRAAAARGRAGAGARHGPAGRPGDRRQGRAGAGRRARCPTRPAPSAPPSCACAPSTGISTRSTSWPAPRRRSA